MTGNRLALVPDPAASVSNDVLACSGNFLHHFVIVADVPRGACDGSVPLLRGVCLLLHCGATRVLQIARERAEAGGFQISRLSTLRLKYYLRSGKDYMWRSF